MWLPNAVVSSVENMVDEVFYVGFTLSRVLNEHRERDQPLIFSGWYWAKGSFEGGPFKSRSACYRDAWFRLVHRKPAPRIHADTQRAEAKLKRDARKVA